MLNKKIGGKVAGIIVVFLFLGGIVCFYPYYSTLKKQEMDWAKNNELMPNHSEITTEKLISDSIKTDCDYIRYLKDPKVSSLAKTIFNAGNWRLNSDTILSFLDSLSANDDDSRAFYFRVVTNSYKNADGFYSEALGITGKSYIERNTKEFVDYFIDKKCFSDKDLVTWENIVMLEFSILEGDRNDKSLLKAYIAILNKNAEGFNEKQKATLASFCNGLTQRWDEYFKKQYK